MEQEEYKKKRYTVWLSDDAIRKSYAAIMSKGFPTRSDFIEKAISFYSGYLFEEDHLDFLSDVLLQAIKRTVASSENRIARLLFKIAVEMAKLEQMLASINDMDEETIRRLFAYLTKARFINQKIVQAFIEKNILYQEKKHGNIVFVETDNDGNHKSASEKSTVSNNSGFKITVSGSDSNYEFCWRGAGASLFVFDAAVDLMSFVTLNGNSWQNNNYLSIDGLSPKPLIRFLEENKKIKEINICLDYDPAGIETAEKMRDTLLERGYTLEQINRLYPVYKDWNEQLKAENGVSPIPAKTHPKKDVYNKMIGLLIKINEKAENSYIQWRNKGFEKYGRDFYLTQIKKELCKIGDSVKNGGNNIKQIEDGVLRIADLGINLLCTSENNVSYADIACALEKEYKVYKDKGRLLRRIEDLKREIDCLSKDMVKSGQSLFLLAKSVADTAIRTEIYIKTDYASDMERKHNFEKSPKKDVMKNEITHIKGDEEQCLTL